MKQFGTIFSFELMNYFKNKVFVGVTIAIVLLIFCVMFYPNAKEMLQTEDTKPQDRAVMILADESGDKDFAAAYKAILDAFAASFEEYQVKGCEEGLDWAKDQIKSGEAECIFAIKSATQYDYYVNNLSMYDMNTAIADEILKSQYQLQAIQQAGLGADEAQAILGMAISHETTSLGKDQAQNFFYTYIMLFALYMVILMYGQMIATNVASEKSSRAMELLITSAKPIAMMFGKVLASCAAGLIQLIAVFGSAILFYNVNSQGWADNEIIASIFDMPLSLFVYMLIFFVLGYFIYAFLYGAIGSMASKLEDINTLVMPLTMLFVVAFVVVVSSMSSGNVDNIAMQVCSYVPFTSPMAMFTRIAMSTVPFYQVVISIAILIISVVGVGVISAKIYRTGVLLYGNSPKPGAIIRAIRKA